MNVRVNKELRDAFPHLKGVKYIEIPWIIKVGSDEVPSIVRLSKYGGDNIVLPNNSGYIFLPDCILQVVPEAVSIDHFSRVVDTSKCIVRSYDELKDKYEDNLLIKVILHEMDNFKKRVQKKEESEDKSFEKYWQRRLKKEIREVKSALDRSKPYEKYANRRIIDLNTNTIYEDIFDLSRKIKWCFKLSKLVDLVSNNTKDVTKRGPKRKHKFVFMDD